VPATELTLIDAYQRWLRGLHRRGHALWLCTAQFHHLGLPGPALLAAMEREVERLYRTLLTRLVRDPRRAGPDALPALLGCPDRPVPKRRARPRLADLLPNDGAHYHFVLAVPPGSRLRVPLDRHLRDNAGLYVGEGAALARLDARPVTDPAGRLADYLLKHHKRGTHGSDAILVLPRGHSELPPRPSPPPRAGAAPPELRAGFRRLLARIAAPLSAGARLAVYDRGRPPALLLALTPAAGAGDHARPGDEGRGGDGPLRACAARLWVAGVGEAVTRAGDARLVRRDLEAAFAALVLRDAGFQRTAAFARRAAALAPLCRGECDVVGGETAQNGRGPLTDAKCC